MKQQSIDDISLQQFLRNGKDSFGRSLGGSNTWNSETYFFKVFSGKAFSSKHYYNLKCAVLET